MVLKELTLTNFKNFIGNHTFTFDKLNLVKGKNGQGKSTLALCSVLFGLYGYSEQTLASLQSRGVQATTSVTLALEHDGNDYIIKRSIPTAIDIKINGKTLDLANNALKQDELNKLFKNVDYFRKFRMIDIKQGINILEEGKTGLRKSLVSFNDAVFNNIRIRLQEKKKQREIFNKDNLSHNKHYPSEKRMKVLNDGCTTLGTRIMEVSNEIAEQEKDLYALSNKMGETVNAKSFYNEQINKANKNTCPVCKQIVSVANKAEIIKEANNKIASLSNELASVVAEAETQKEIISHLKTVKADLYNDVARYQKLAVLLESRLSIKEYVYTTKDVLIMKKTIEELDSFTNFYITEWVKVLEPIINNIVKSIGFTVQFVFNSKGEFDIQMSKNGQVFSYKDLSSGQKLILTVAFQIALLIEKGDEGLIIADEGFASLDEDNLNMIFDLFKDLPFQLVSIIHRLDNIPNNLKVISL